MNTLHTISHIISHWIILIYAQRMYNNIHLYMWNECVILCQQYPQIFPQYIGKGICVYKCSHSTEWNLVIRTDYVSLSRTDGLFKMAIWSSNIIWESFVFQSLHLERFIDDLIFSEAPHPRPYRTFWKFQVGLLYTTTRFPLKRRGWGRLRKTGNW